jgi:hypothetical protein
LPPQFAEKIVNVVVEVSSAAIDAIALHSGKNDAHLSAGIHCGCCGG